MGEMIKNHRTAIGLSTCFSSISPLCLTGDFSQRVNVWGAGFSVIHTVLTFSYLWFLISRPIFVDNIPFLQVLDVRTFLLTFVGWIHSVCLWNLMLLWLNLLLFVWSYPFFLLNSPIFVVWTYPFCQVNIPFSRMLKEWIPSKLPRRGRRSAETASLSSRARKRGGGTWECPKKPRSFWIPLAMGYTKGARGWGGDWGFLYLQLFLSEIEWDVWHIFHPFSISFLVQKGA